MAPNSRYRSSFYYLEDQYFYPLTFRYRSEAERPCLVSSFRSTTSRSRLQRRGPRGVQRIPNNYFGRTFHKDKYLYLVDPQDVVSLWKVNPKPTGSPNATTTSARRRLHRVADSKGRGYPIPDLHLVSLEFN